MKRPDLGTFIGLIAAILAVIGAILVGTSKG